MRWITIILLVLLSAGTAHAANQVGFRQLHIPSAERPLDLAIWYPAAAGGRAIKVADNAVFTGQSVLADAPIAPGRHRLVMVSHGYSGNWASLAWLAVDLARRGYVVAAVNHPGTTTENMDPKIGARLWERPHDISRAVDLLASDPAWKASVSTDSVIAIGHSLGGWTVVALAGGRLDPDRLDADCARHAELAACDLIRTTGAGRTPAARAAMAQSLRDPRIKIVVSLDLGLAGGFDPSSLAGVTIPVLVVAAGEPNPQIPAALESGRLWRALPRSATRHLTIQGARHFSFLPVCKPSAAAILAEGSPGDVEVCRDGPGADREAIHRRVALAVTEFLVSRLPPCGQRRRGGCPADSRR